MPKILQMLKPRKRRKGRLRRALRLPDKAPANIITLPPVFPDVQEEYPDYEIISRWLKLADEMLGSADYSHMNGHDHRDGRKKA